MKKLFALRDVKTSCFGVPFGCQYEQEAVRHFDAAVNYGKDIVAQYPQDFDLYEIGTFDERTGVVVGLSEPELVVNGAVLKKKEVSE